MGDLVTSVRITQECDPSCARLGSLSPGSFKSSTVTNTVGDTTATKVQYFSHAGASTVVVQDFLRNNIAMASTSEKVLNVTLTVTVGSVLRGLSRSSNTLKYNLVFNGAPTLSDDFTSKSGDVNGFSPFDSIEVTDLPGETDTFRGVIEFECSRGLETCVNGVPRIVGSVGTAAQVETFLRELVVVWSAGDITPRVPTATVFFGDHREEYFW